MIDPWPLRVQPLAVSERISTTHLGRRGEDVAAAYLAGLGYRILVRNYRCRRGELDIVALDGATVAFVEVKLRRETGPALEAVDFRKQQRLAAAALDFLARSGMLEKPARFDVVAVNGRTLECTLLRHAFDCPAAD